MSAASDSPCIRQCCLNQDDICIGCFRTLDNILKWTTYSSDMRQQVLAECAVRKACHQHEAARKAAGHRKPK